jgi:hypothetical protein
MVGRASIVERAGMVERAGIERKAGMEGRKVGPGPIKGRGGCRQGWVEQGGPMIG